MKRLQRLAVCTKVSEQRLHEEQHQQAAGEVQNSRQASGQQQTQSAYWWKRRHSWVAVAESERQTSEPPNSQRNFTWGGEIHRSSVDSFADYSQSSASQVLQEKVHSTADWSAQHARVILVCSLRDDNVITSKPTWKLKHANLIILEPLNISTKYHQNRSI